MILISSRIERFVASETSNKFDNNSLTTDCFVSKIRSIVPLYPRTPLRNLNLLLLLLLLSLWYRAGALRQRLGNIRANVLSRRNVSTPSQVGVTRSTCIARCCSPGQADAAGSQRTWIESCNAKCSCGSDDVRVQLVPVCVNDAARRYYSPCHAGCSRLQQTSDGRIVSSAKVLCVLSPQQGISTVPCSLCGSVAEWLERWTCDQ